MRVEQIIDKLTPGAKFLYHTGDLARDRLKDPELDNLATFIYGRAAPKHFVIAADEDTGYVQMGQGKGQCIQERRGDHDYQYFYIENSHG